MEYASVTREMPLPENLRVKQKEAIEWFKTKTDLVLRLPTGYGKTLTAAGCFAQMYYQGKANRLLYIVPRTNQAKQAAEDICAALDVFGIKTKSTVVGDDQIRAQNAHVKNTMCAFIVTVQSLLPNGTWATITSMMETGKWFVCVDEHHHYSNDEDGKWTQKLKDLNYSGYLAMSATPKRHDRSDYHREPDISATYREAAEHGYVKRLSLHAYHYVIDAVTVDGRVIQYTTEKLADEAGSDSSEAIDAFIASKKMRFSPKYVSPLVTFPLDRIIDLRTRGMRAQMLVQAMSCSHAQCVYDQIRMLVPDNISVDWVGTGPSGRDRKKNEEIIKRFCPPKNKATGKRDWDLDILINVGIASEGLDCIDVTEVVFLTPANITISNKQTIGRAARPMVGLKTSQPKGHINVDTQSPMAAFIGEKIMDIFENDCVQDENNGDEREPWDRDESEYDPLPEKLSWEIADVRLIDIRSEPLFKEVFAKTREKTDLAKSDEEVSAIAEAAIYKYLNRSNNESVIHAQLTDQVKSSVGKIAGLVMRRISSSGIRVERTMMGDLCKRINSKKKHELGSVPEALDEEALNRHYQWLRDLEKRILLSHGLEGVPQWLR